MIPKLHWGEPINATEIRSWTGAVGLGCNGSWRHCFTTHEIGRWYGLSFKRSWFFGFCLFGASRDYRTGDPPRTGIGAKSPPRKDTEAVGPKAICHDCMTLDDWEIVDPQIAAEMRADLEDDDPASPTDTRDAQRDLREAEHG